MTIGVLEESHPQIVVGHPGDQVGLTLRTVEPDAARGEFSDGERDVVADEIERRTGRGVVRFSSSSRTPAQSKKVRSP